MDQQPQTGSSLVAGLVEYGPELALALFSGFIIYAIALLAISYRRRIPGLNWLGGHSLTQDMTVSLTLLALVPAIALTLLLAADSARDRETRAAAEMKQATAALEQTLDRHFHNHQLGIASLAESISRAGRFDQQSIGEWLESHHAIYRDYLTMLAANSFGDIVTATTMLQGRPERLADVRHNISDRDYFSVPMNEGGTYVSDVFRGRGLGSDPIVAFSSVVRTATGMSWGIVEGSLNLEELGSNVAAARLLALGAELLVLDSQDRVLYSSTKDLNKLDPLPDARASYYGMASTNHTRASSSIGRTRDDSELVSYQVTDIGWQIIATRPLQPIYQAAYGEFRLLLILMLATVLSAALLSMAIARRVRQPLHTLTEAVRALDLDGSEAQITAPPNAPVEIRDLFGHLATVSQRLQSSYRQLMAASEAGRHYREQLEQTLARRENEIQSRTRELEDTNDKLRTLSNIDELTGLANRRHFLETMDRAWRHGLRENEPVSVIIIDIDHFKAYNDHYGHLGGDQCLQRVADAMAGVVGRSLDIVARCGGEEFMIVLGGTGLDGALVLGERVRQLIEDLAIPHLGSVTDSILTVSVGVASTTPVRGSDYDDLIRAADQALYHAKNDGRNRVGRSDGDGVSIFVADAAAFDFNDHIDLRPIEKQ